MTEKARALLAEGVGVALLAAIVVGSGIMGERLASGNAAITSDATDTTCTRYGRSLPGTFCALCAAAANRIAST